MKKRKNDMRFSFVLAFLLLLSPLSGKKLFAVNDGEAMFEKIASKLFAAKTLAVDMSVSLSRLSKGDERQLALDLGLGFDEGKKGKRKKIVLETQYAGKPLEMKLNIFADDIYFHLSLPEQPAIAYHISLAEGIDTLRNASEETGLSSSIIDISGLENSKDEEMQFPPPPGSMPDKARDHRFIGQRQKDFLQHSKLEKPFQRMIKKIRDEIALIDGGKAGQEAVSAVSRRSRIIHMKPNLIKFIPKSKTEGTAKLYYDPKSYLPQSLDIRDPQRNMRALIAFGKWNLDSEVDTSLPLEELHYRSFSTNIFSRFIAALGSFAGKSR